MWRIIKYHAPQNAFIADTIRFCEQVKRLEVSWTANAPPSEGVERFVDEYLPTIRKNNPQVIYLLHRTHVFCDPFISAIYNWERPRRQRLNFKHECQILAMVEQWALGGDYRKGRKRGVKTIPPRGAVLWDTEVKGHDVFKVFSKWKGDPPDPNEITSMNHPHMRIKHMWGKTTTGKAMTEQQLEEQAWNET